MMRLSLYCCSRRILNMLTRCTAVSIQTCVEVYRYELPKTSCSFSQLDATNSKYGNRWCLWRTHWGHKSSWFLWDRVAAVLRGADFVQDQDQDRAEARKGKSGLGSHNPLGINTQPNWTTEPHNIRGHLWVRARRSMVSAKYFSGRRMIVLVNEQSVWPSKCTA